MCLVIKSQTPRRMIPYRKCDKRPQSFLFFKSAQLSLTRSRIVSSDSRTHLRGS